jgi:CubicO group peptidase (beta-lactamase class C family)
MIWQRGTLYGRLRIIVSMNARTLLQLLLTGVFIAPCLPAPLFGQESTIIRLDGSRITPPQIDATVTRLMRTAHVPGVGIAIFNNGRLAFLKAYGVRDTEKHLPLTPNSVLTAASLTKVTFATMVMQLVQEHIIDLDRPVYQYLPKPLPDYPAYRDLANDPRYKLITMRMLLSHTSGFPNWRRFMDDKKLSINFAPGSRFAYSGEGIDLAQMVVETVTTQTVEELMQKRVFEPLSMTRTSFLWDQRSEDDYANGYDEQGTSLGPERWRKSDAAGSMQTTLSDYAKFARAMLNGRLLNQESRRQMLRPQISILSKHEFPSLAVETTTENQFIHLSYGLGWGLYWSPKGQAFFKEGHDDGWRSYLVCFDKPKTAMLIMTNSSNGEDMYSGLLEGIIGDSYTPLEWEGFRPSHDTSPAHP